MAEKKPAKGPASAGKVGNPWRDSLGRFCSKGKDVDGKRHSKGTSKPKDPYWEI